METCEITARDYDQARS